jgi:hypothetical protein
MKTGPPVRRSADGRWNWQCTQHQPAVIRSFRAAGTRRAAHHHLTDFGSRYKTLFVASQDKEGQKMKPMMPDEVKPLFGNVNLEVFLPLEYSDYAIFRVHEYGDVPAANGRGRHFPNLTPRRVPMTEGQSYSHRWWVMLTLAPAFVENGSGPRIGRFESGDWIETVQKLSDDNQLAILTDQSHRLTDRVALNNV